MPRLYAIPFNGTITNSGGDTDLFSVQPADDIPVAIAGFSLGQISEVGDAAEEGLRCTIRYLPATFTVGSGGNSVSAVSPTNDPAGTTFGATIRTNDTTVATTSGTALIRHEAGWNERATPYDFFFPDISFMPGARQATGLVLREETTAADDLTGCMTLWVLEAN